MNKNDGGPAFPSPYSRIDSNPGMSLRDYFAAAALTGLLSSGIAAKRGQTSEDVAAIAYRNADAMLAERSKP